MDSECTTPCNLGNPGEFSIKEAAEIIKELTNSKSNIIYLPQVIDDPSKRKPDIEKAKKYLGWEPKVSLKDGLIPTIEYFKKCIEDKDFNFNYGK